MSTSLSKKAIAAALALVAVALGGFFLIGGPDEFELAAATATPGAGGGATQEAPKSGLAAHDKNGDGVVYQAGMHPHVIQDEPGQCPICGMDLMPVRVDGMEEGTVKVDPVTLQNIGVRTAPVTVESLGNVIRTTGRFEMDEQGERTVSLKVGGWIEKLYANYEGARVRKGQPLLELYSPELVSTQEEYLLAVRNAERLAGTAAAKDAQRLLEAARRRLAYWDLSEAQIRQLEEAGKPRRTITFYAPSSGEVMRKQVSEGDHVTAGQRLMDIVDLSKVWLMVDVYEQDLGWVGIGTPARIELPYQPGKVYEGRVDYIYHMLDMETRAAKARIVLPGGHNAPLKPGMYATVELAGRESEPLPTVPEEAVIRTGEEEVVVLALGDGRFRPVKVEAGVQSRGKVQILAGLEGGEEVVTSAQFLIDSEARLQSAVGAMMAGAESAAATATTEDARSASAAPAEPAAAAQPATQQGGQVVKIAVSPTGYAPKQVRLKAGVPTTLVFTRKEEAGCTGQVQIPAFGIAATDLPVGEPVAFEVTPEQDGTFTFACGMDMMKGSLIVTSAG